MTPERWQRIKDVFSAASVLPDTERRAFLADACLDDPELRSEVESLLQAHAQEIAIVDRPAAALLPGDMIPPVPDRWLGRRIGSYEIVSLIARGGMGAVYRARRVDEAYEKDVAIKLVSGGAYGSFVLRRLQAERQILAGLEHPNIARLLDGGATDDGSPYLVMELIDGEPIDAYVEARDLPVRKRLELFREVCAAVSYAHQHLIVHRDLKPGNILVTAAGTVKLLDFGIAKLLQPAAPETGAAPTRTLMQVLTPGFASPEQVLGKPITTASDVYSLGVVLYLLLTGRSPYRNALDTAKSAIREICETDPVRPSMVVGAQTETGRERLGRDLDAIIMRALRKEPERRYGSVDQFSEDIRRHLEGLPVLARGDRLSYRAGRFLRRHRLEMAAAGLVATALVGTTVFSMRQARIAVQERERAERHFASVRGLANAFLFRVHDAIKELPGSLEAQDLLVGTALEYLDALAAEAGDDHELRVELAAAYQKIADIQGAPNQASQGHVQAAIDSYARSIELLEPVIAGDAGNLRARTLLADSLVRQSRLLLYTDRVQETADASAQAVATLEALAKLQPDTRTKRSLAMAYLRHQDNLRYVQPPGAPRIEYARMAMDLMEELKRSEPHDLQVDRDLAEAYAAFGFGFLGPERQQEALDQCLAMQRKVLAIMERLVAATSSQNVDFVRELLFSHAGMSALLMETGDHPAALEHARAAQASLAILKSDGDNAQAMLDEAVVANRLGPALFATGQVGEATAVFEQNLRVLERMDRETGLPSKFLRGRTEQGLGAIQSSLAARPGIEPAVRLDHLRQALAWFEKAVLHMDSGEDIKTMDHMNRREYDQAVAGIAQCKSEIGE